MPTQSEKLHKIKFQQLKVQLNCKKLQPSSLMSTFPWLSTQYRNIMLLLKKHEKFAGWILFLLHHQKTKTRQKHSHTPDNRRVRLKKGNKFLVGYHKKNLPSPTPQGIKKRLNQIQSSLPLSSFLSQYWFCFGISFTFRRPCKQPMYPKISQRKKVSRTVLDVWKVRQKNSVIYLNLQSRGHRVAGFWLFRCMQNLAVSMKLCQETVHEAFLICCWSALGHHTMLLCGNRTRYHSSFLPCFGKLLQLNSE